MILTIPEKKASAVLKLLGEEEQRRQRQKGPRNLKKQNWSKKRRNSKDGQETNITYNIW